MGDIKTHSSVCLSVCPKNLNLAYIFWSITDRALIFGMHHPCDKSFLLVPCGNLDPDLWSTSRTNLLSGGNHNSSYLLVYFMPPDWIIGGILFLFCLFVCLFVRLSVCLSVVNFNLHFNIWTVSDTDFLFGVHTQLMMPFQMTPRSSDLCGVCAINYFFWTLLRHSVSQTRVFFFLIFVIDTQAILVVLYCRNTLIGTEWIPHEWA